MAAALRFKRKKLEKTRPRVTLPLSNSADEAVIATDLSGKVVFWNLVAERLYGWKWQEAVGRPISELVVPESSQQDAAKILEQLRRGQSWTGEFKLRRRDGTEFVATVTDRPMKDSQGNLVGIIGITHAVKDPLSSKRGTLANERSSPPLRRPPIVGRGG